VLVHALPLDKDILKHLLVTQEAAFIFLPENNVLFSPVIDFQEVQDVHEGDGKLDLICSMTGIRWACSTCLITME
jgi:hypothetical protein